METATNNSDSRRTSCREVGSQDASRDTALAWLPLSLSLEGDEKEMQDGKEMRRRWEGDEKEMGRRPEGDGKDTRRR